MTTDSLTTLAVMAIMFTAITAVNYQWHRLTRETAPGFASIIVRFATMVTSATCVLIIAAAVFPFDKGDPLQIAVIVLSITFGVPAIQVWIMNLGERHRKKDLME